MSCRHNVFNVIYTNTLGPRQNGRHFADDIFKLIFLNENAWIPIKISLKFVPQGPINNIPALVQIIAWRRPGEKPLSGPMMVRLPTHICVTRSQWVNPMVFDVTFMPSVTYPYLFAKCTSHCILWLMPRSLDVFFWYLTFAPKCFHIWFKIKL